MCRVLQPGLNAMNIWSQFQMVHLAHEKVSELYSMEEEKSGDIKPDKSIQGKIELKNIDFKYPTQNETLLEDISLTVNAGDSISITGNNGSGKTTLIALLSGFLHPDKGEILLDENNIYSYEFEYLRTQVEDLRP